MDGEITLYRLNGEDEVISYTKPDNTREPRNAGKTLHEGIEVGGTWQISDQLDQKLKISGSWARHHYEQFQPSATIDYSGNDMPSAPKLLVRLNIKLSQSPNYYSQQKVYM